MNVEKCAVLRFCRGVVDWDALGLDAYYYLGNQRIQIVDSHKDLGVTIDTSLRFHGHIRNIANVAGGLVSNLLRLTISRSAAFMLPLYVTHVRPLLEFASCVWFTQYVGDMRVLESVQRRWTQNIEGLENLEYYERLQRLELFSVKGRLIRGDLIKYWKIFHGKCVLRPGDLFDLAPRVGTRGHDFKIMHRHCFVELKRRYFGVRSVELWNALPAELVLLGDVGASRLVFRIIWGHCCLSMWIDWL